MCSSGASEKPETESLALTDVRLVSEPALPVIRSEDGHGVHREVSGQSLQLRAIAEYADGSTKDITEESSTEFFPLFSHGLAKVSADGRVLFLEPETKYFRLGAIGVGIVGYEEVKAVFFFEVVLPSENEGSAEGSSP